MNTTSTNQLSAGQLVAVKPHGMIDITTESLFGIISAIEPRFNREPLIRVQHFDQSITECTASDIVALPDLATAESLSRKILNEQ